MEKERLATLDGKEKRNVKNRVLVRLFACLFAFFFFLIVVGSCCVHIVLKVRAVQDMESRN